MDLSSEHCKTVQQLIEENRVLRLRLKELEAAASERRADTPSPCERPGSAAPVQAAIQSLAQADDRFHTCLDNMLDCFAILSSVRDASGRIVDLRFDYINQAGCRCNGLPLEQHLGRTLLEVLPNHRTCRLFEEYCRVAETGEPAELESVEYEDPRCASAQVTRAFDVRAWKLGDGIAVSWRDVTSRKQAEEDLQRLTRHARCSLWKAFVTGLPGWDTPEALENGSQFMRWESKVFDVEAARTVVDLRLEPGERYEEIWCRDRVPEDNLRMARTALQSMQRGSPTYDQEFRCVDRHGQIQWLYESVALVPLERGRWQAFGVVVNISAQKAAEEELQRAKAAAEAANHAKDHFIAMLSHELRTPLTPALVVVSALQEDLRLPADVRDDLAIVRRNIGLEVRLIADLLDVSRIISGKLHLDKRLVDVAAAIRDAARIVSSDLMAKDQTLTIETPGSPYLALADSARLQQVFWNLLRNAIKFTPPRGRIAVRASLDPTERGPLAAGSCGVAEGDCPLPPSDIAPDAGQGYEGNLVITVSDSGCGIAPQLLPRLFNAFEQAQGARAMGGLGLGLTICRAVVEMHGGSISAHSDGPGSGATFTLRLPVARCCSDPAGASSAVRPSLPEVAPADAGTAASLHVLVVEDNQDTAHAMQRLLRMRGYQVGVAGDIAAALQAIEAQVPDLLICDIGLPDGSGLDLMRQIRDKRGAIPAIALSGYGQEQDIRHSREAGFLMHLVKPIDPAQLCEAIATTMAARAGRL